MENFLRVLRIDPKGHTLSAARAFSLALLLSFPLTSAQQLLQPHPANAASSPTVTSISPASGPTAGGTSVIISGTNFFQGKNVTKVAAGEAHSCAIADGKVYCWGNNSDGRLGDGTSTQRNTPVLATGDLVGKTATDISADWAHTCAVADGKAYCWGANNNGRVGDNTNVNKSSPTQVAGELSGKTVTSISTGAENSCAVADGKAYCWGFRGDGRLGDGSTSPNSLVPVAVKTDGVLAGKTVTKVSTANGYSCAVADGAPYCWGVNGDGQLGNGTKTASLVPVSTLTSGALDGKTVTSISTGYTHACAVADGKAYCWGSRSSGRLGDGTTSGSSEVPIAATTSGALSGKTVTDITASRDHTCAVADGKAYCWGAGGNGRLGDGAEVNRSVAVAVTGITDSLVVGVYASSQHTCTAADGVAYCWGLGNNGRLGNGSTGGNHSSPLAVNLVNVPSSANPSVRFGGTPAASVTFVSSSQLAVVTPAHSAGAVNVTVTNPDLAAATLANSYTYIPPIVIPGPPLDLTTTPADKGVTLTWSTPSNNGGAPITNYLVEYRVDGTSNWQTFPHPLSEATNMTVTGLVPSTTYNFRVSAINSAGTGTPSTIATGTPIYITLSSPPSISLHVTPTANSRTSSTSHSVVTSTNSPGGYTLSVSMEGSDRTLTHNNQPLAATSGTSLSPAALNLNSWGFRVAGVGNFGAGGSIEDGVEHSSYTWAGVPSVDSPAIVKATSSPTQNDTATIWYGMRVDTQKPSGTYSGSVMYTVVAN